jgi:hypothetical protein
MVDHEGDIDSSDQAPRSDLSYALRDRDVVPAVTAWTLFAVFVVLLMLYQALFIQPLWRAVDAAQRETIALTVKLEALRRDFDDVKEKGSPITDRRLSVLEDRIKR